MENEEDFAESYEAFEIPDIFYADLRPYDKLAFLLIRASDAAYSTKEIAELIDFLDKKFASSQLKVIESKG